MCLVLLHRLNTFVLNSCVAFEIAEQLARRWHGRMREAVPAPMIVTDVVLVVGHFFAASVRCSVSMSSAMLASLSSQLGQRTLSARVASFICASRAADAFCVVF